MNLENIKNVISKNVELFESNKKPIEAISTCFNNLCSIHESDKSFIETYIKNKFQSKQEEINLLQNEDNFNIFMLTVFITDKLGDLNPSEHSMKTVIDLNNLLESYLFTQDNVPFSKFFNLIECQENIHNEHEADIFKRITIKNELQIKSPTSIPLIEEQTEFSSSFIKEEIIIACVKAGGNLNDNSIPSLYLCNNLIKRKIFSSVGNQLHEVFEKAYKNLNENPLINTQEFASYIIELFKKPLEATPIIETKTKPRF